MPNRAKSARPGMKHYWPELENKLLSYMNGS